MNVDLAPQKPLFPEILAQTKLYDLIGDGSTLLFQKNEILNRRCSISEIFCHQMV